MLITKNRKAFFDYVIKSKLEAGIILLGHEVKSVIQGSVNLADTFVTVEKGEAYINNMHISQYKYSAGVKDYDPYRKRKLLLKKDEIEKMALELKQSGLTVVPLSIYLKNGHIKVEIGLAKGKKLYDKREKEKKEKEIRDAERIKKAVRL